MAYSSEARAAEPPVRIATARSCRVCVFLFFLRGWRTGVRVCFEKTGSGMNRVVLEYVL